MPTRTQTAPLAATSIAAASPQLREPSLAASEVPPHNSDSEEPRDTSETTTPSSTVLPARLCNALEGACTCPTSGVGLWLKLRMGQGAELRHGDAIDAAGQCDDVGESAARVDKRNLPE